MNKLITEFLSQFTRDEIESAQISRTKARKDMIEGLEESLVKGESIGGRLRFMVRGIETGEGDGLSMETLNEFAARHDLDLGDVLKAAQERDPQSAILKLLRGK